MLLIQEITDKHYIFNDIKCNIRVYIKRYSL